MKFNFLNYYQEIKHHLRLLSKSWISPLLLSIVCTILIYKKLNAHLNHLEFSAKKVDIVVSSKTLPQGKILEEQDLKIISIPHKHLPAGIIYPSNISTIIGTPVNKTLALEELILWSSLNIEDINYRPSDKIEVGYRSLAVSVNSISSMGNRIQKGDRIDLLHTSTLPGDEHPTTYALLQNVPVLNVGDFLSEENDPYSTLVLMVLPPQAGLILNAKEYGELSFLLRNPDDYKTQETLPMISHKNIIKTAFRNALQKEHDNGIEIIKGNKIFNAK